MRQPPCVPLVGCVDERAADLITQVLKRDMRFTGAEFASYHTFSRFVAIPGDNLDQRLVYACLA